MALEIERKFLVRGDFRASATSSQHVVQGYLCPGKGRNVRVRLQEERGFITVKGPVSASGMSRFEWEHPISADEARALLELCDPGRIDKTRHLVPVGAHVFEVDEFHGENQGLVVAEIELSAENEPFERPPWLGPEVTGDPRYYNAALAKRPFTRW